MKSLPAEDVLKYMTDLLLYYLEQLANIDSNSSEQFLYGERQRTPSVLKLCSIGRKPRNTGLISI